MKSHSNFALHCLVLLPLAALITCLYPLATAIAQERSARNSKIDPSPCESSPAPSPTDGKTVALGNGSRTLTIPIKRFIPGVDREGRLTAAMAKELADNGVLRPCAEISFALVCKEEHSPEAAENQVEVPCQAPRVIARFNGVVIEKYREESASTEQNADGGAEDSAFLGRVVRYKVPVELLKFPKAPGKNGNEPVAAENTLVVEYECTGVTVEPSSE